MKWVSKEAKFRYCGKPVVRKTVTSNTPLGEFKVYESVGGNVFVVHPFIQRSGGLPGYNPDPDNEFSTPKIAVANIEEGIKKCEAKWNQIKQSINDV